MSENVQKIYEALCKQLGQVRYEISQLNEKEKALLERVESVQWVSKQLPKDKKDVETAN